MCGVPQTRWWGSLRGSLCGSRSVGCCVGPSGLVPQSSTVMVPQTRWRRLHHAVRCGAADACVCEACLSSLPCMCAQPRHPPAVQLRWAVPHHDRRAAPRPRSPPHLPVSPPPCRHPGATMSPRVHAPGYCTSPCTPRGSSACHCPAGGVPAGSLQLVHLPTVPDWQPTEL